MSTAYALKVTAQQSSGDWPMFRADPSHSGAGTGNSVLTPTLLWNYTTGSDVWSSPAVVNGVVYVGGGNNVYALGGSPTSSSSSTLSSALFIIIGLVVAVVIVAAVVFLMFQNRLKNKPTSPPPPPQNYFRKAVDNLFD